MGILTPVFLGSLCSLLHPCPSHSCDSWGPLTNLSERMKEPLVLSLRVRMNVTSRDVGPMLEEKNSLWYVADSYFLSNTATWSDIWLLENWAWLSEFQTCLLHAPILPGLDTLQEAVSSWPWGSAVHHYAINSVLEKNHAWVYTYLSLLPWAFLVAPWWRKILPVQEAWFDPWVRKIPWRREWQPAYRSCLENPMDRGGWQAAVHEVTKESDAT